MARPPKPDALKRRIGTARPDRERAPLAVFPSGEPAPKCPVKLGTIGRRAWRQYWQVGDAWLSRRTDLAIVARLCRLYDDEANLYAEVEREGYLVRGAMGGLVGNPAVIMLRKVQAELRQCEGLCGFTPSDRSRLGLSEVKRQSKLESFLASQREAQSG